MLHTIRAWGIRFAMLMSVVMLLGIASGHLPVERVIPLAYRPTTIGVDPTRVPVTPVRPPTHPTIAAVCLAQNLYFEANNEPLEGLQAVAATVFNRMLLRGEYPSSVCGVVYQPFQYSWTTDFANWSRMPPTIFLQMAREFLQDRDILTQEYPVTHFHHVAITPPWSKTLPYVMTVGQHKFYGI